MPSSSVLVGNVYVMMAYAFRTLSPTDGVPHATTEFDHIPDLLADIVARETTKQVKRSLDHDYRQETRELPTVRGRVDLQASIRERSFVRGGLVCCFDEYVADTPINRAVRATVLMLARNDRVAEPRRDALARLLPFFEDVQAVPPRAIRINTLVNVYVLRGECIPERDTSIRCKYDIVTSRLGDEISRNRPTVGQ